MVGAGVAIFKPDSSPNFELRIRDEDGNDPLNGVFIPRGEFHCLSLVHMPPPLTRRNRPVLTLLASRPLAAIVRFSGGSASALPVSRPDQHSHVAACGLAESPKATL